MMNRIALASLGLLMSLGVFAQNGSKWKIGVKAGFNHTDQLASMLPKSPSLNLNKLYNQSTDWLSGLSAGLHSSLSLSEKIALNADLLYNQRGFRGRAIDTVLQGGNYVNRLHYLSLPLYGGLRLNSKLGIDLGIETSYFLGLTGKYNGEKIENPNTDAFSDLDFGLLGGLTYQIHSRLAIQGRYYWGTRNTYDITFTDVNGQPISSQPKYINHGVQFSLTVFPF